MVTPKLKYETIGYPKQSTNDLFFHKGQICHPYASSNMRFLNSISVI